MLDEIARNSLLSFNRLACEAYAFKPQESTTDIIFWLYFVDFASGSGVSTETHNSLNCKFSSIKVINFE